MREILFRGKDIDTGNWVEGWYLRHPFSRWPLKDVITPAEEAENGHHHYVEVDPATVGQYTGLKDKNGQRIFEGDVVEVDLEEQPSACLVGVVHFVNGVYMLKHISSALSLCAYRNYCTVIGNVHDNPEPPKEE